jgi:hypothetical protein
LKTRILLLAVAAAFLVSYIASPVYQDTANSRAVYDKLVALST